MVPLAAGLAFLLLTAQSLPSAPQAPQGDFCARLAGDSGIKLRERPDGRSDWSENALSFGQRVLVGGAAAIGVGVTPVEPATVEEYRRLENMCLPEGKGAICRLVGPVNFKFIWKGRKIVTPVAAGERATVILAGTRASCRSEPSA